MDYRHNHGDYQQMSLTPKKVSKVKALDADASWSIEGVNNGSFAIASSKKELKQLMKSVADVVYYEKKVISTSTTTALPKAGARGRWVA